MMTQIRDNSAMGGGLAVLDADQGVQVLDWLDEELVAWEMPELISTPDWIEAHVEIPGRDAAIPGPVSLEITPYLRGIFAVIDEQHIEIVTCVFGTQLGKTLFAYGTMLALTAQRPGPILLVSPTEPDSREIAGTTLRNFVMGCVPVRELLPGGPESLTKEGPYVFRPASWYFGWSNSAASLARRACRYVVYDEVEKMPLAVGKESDPIRLGDARLRTFRNTAGAMSIRISSPTTVDGLIGRSFEASDRRSYWVPCLRCGQYQVLSWSQVRWPHDDAGHSVDPDLIRDNDLATYECVGCKGQWDNADRISATRRGMWARRGESVEKGRRGPRITGKAEKPGSRHAGFHISALYSPFVTVSQLAADFLEVQHDLSGLLAFVNQELGEFWEDTQIGIDEAEIRKHRGLYPMGTVPMGVQVLTCGVDVQRGWFVVEVRGWGFGLEAWVIDARLIETEAQLHEYLRDSRFDRADDRGNRIPPEKEAPMAIRLTLIDSGDQTHYVYELVQAWRDIDMRPTKGFREISGALKVRASPIRKDPRTKRSYSRRMMMYGIDTGFMKDAQARLAGVKEEGPGYLHVPADMHEEWFRQFLSEHKVPDRKPGKRRLSSQTRWVWQPRTERRVNHWWDCAVLNMAATDPQLLNLRNLRPPGSPPPATGPIRTGRVGRFGGR